MPMATPQSRCPSEAQLMTFDLLGALDVPVSASMGPAWEAGPEPSLDGRVDSAGAIDLSLRCPSCPLACPADPSWTNCSVARKTWMLW